MAYEVVKTIRGHEYRYGVESYRDPETGKVRNKWTYLGKANGTAPARPKRRQAADATRDRIVSVFLKIIERTSLDRATPSAIAREAKISTATFYRHFASRDALVALCTQRANAEQDLRLSQLHDIAQSEAQERVRLRSFAIDLVRIPAAPPALFRAWSLSPEGVREKRHGQRIAAFSEYIDALKARGYLTGAGNTRRTAIALSMMVMTFLRRSMIENQLLSEEEFAVVGDVFERLIFG